MKIDLKPQVFSNLILTLLLPIRLIKKFPKNSFVGGLIFGAIFSLIVNIITVQLQESIQKQRILEAMENEILQNLLQANNTITENNISIKNNDAPNYYHPFSTYSRDLWEQSSEPLRYISQLDSDVQAQVSLLYTVIFRGYNQMINKLDSMVSDHLKNCYAPETVITAAEKSRCLYAYQSFLQTESSIASDAADKILGVQKIFHPTADRLQNPFLRFIMGNKSTRVLSGK